MKHSIPFTFMVLAKGCMINLTFDDELGAASLLSNWHEMGTLRASAELNPSMFSKHLNVPDFEYS